MRSGSIYALLERIWRLIAGKGEVSDKNLNEFMQEIRDLEKFRFMYGLKVETKDELHKLLEWLRKNSIDIGSAQRARRWIDSKSTELIRLPPKNYLRIKGVMASICILLVMVFVQVSTYQFALLQMKASKTWLLADSKVVSGFLGNWTIDKAQCLANLGNVSTVGGLTKTETTLICEALKGDTLKQIVIDTVKAQRSLGALFGVGAFIWLIVIFFQMTSAEAAIKINKAVTNTVVLGNNTEKADSTTPHKAVSRKRNLHKENSGESEPPA